MADFEWVNKGSCADLSELADDSMWPSSMAGGNMQSSNKLAMTAPGSEPVDPVPDRSEQGDPHVALASPMPPATDGKPKARTDHTPAPRPSWGPTTRPKTVVTGRNGTTTT
jgi:hypothetical protein